MFADAFIMPYFEPIPTRVVAISHFGDGSTTVQNSGGGTVEGTPARFIRDIPNGANVTLTASVPAGFEALWFIGRDYDTPLHTGTQFTLTADNILSDVIVVVVEAVEEVELQPIFGDHLVIVPIHLNSQTVSVGGNTNNFINVYVEHSPELSDTAELSNIRLNVMRGATPVFSEVMTTSSAAIVFDVTNAQLSDAGSYRVVVTYDYNPDVTDNNAQIMFGLSLQTMPITLNVNDTAFQPQPQQAPWVPSPATPSTSRRERTASTPRQAQPAPALATTPAQLPLMPVISEEPVRWHFL
jgi:hypothetical protein